MLEIKDIKKGNSVECLDDVGFGFVKGQIYEIEEDGLSDNGCVRVVVGSHRAKYGFNPDNFKLHEIKNDEYGSFSRRTISKYRYELEDINNQRDRLMKNIIVAQEAYINHLEKEIKKL